MPRSPRHDPDDGWHHVMNRGVDRMDIYVDDHDRRWFLRLLGQAARETGVQVVAYCQVGNHFHLLVRCPDGGLSKFVWKLTSEYARIFNRRHGRDGPLFRGRFSSKLVDSDAYLTTLIRYIHRNSLDLGVSPESWPWSSYRCYLGSSPQPRWLAPEVALRIIGGVERHRTAVETRMPYDKRVEAGAEPADLHAAWRSATAERAVREVGELLEGVSSLTSAQRRAGVLVLAVDRCGLSIGELMGLLGEDNPSTVRSRVHRSRQRVATDPQLAAAIELASTQLRHAA